MKLKYALDIGEKSTWFVNTPSELSKRLPFYINEYGHYMAGPTYFTERQKQKNYLFIYTISGKGYLKYSQKEYVLEPHQAVIIHCDNYHMYKTFQSDIWNFKWFHFNGTSAKEYFTLLNQDGLNILTVNDPATFENMVDGLFSLPHINDIPSNVKLSMITTNIISFLIMNRFTPAKSKKYSEHRSDIEKVINYIYNSYQKKIDIDDLVKIACVSKYYFIRLFKNHTGVCPYDFIINYRINKAKELLRTTDYTIGEICVMTGFNDYNNFIRGFKKVVGITPLKYRSI